MCRRGISRFHSVGKTKKSLLERVSVPRSLASPLLLRVYWSGWPGHIESQASESEGETATLHYDSAMRSV